MKGKERWLPGIPLSACLLLVFLTISLPSHAQTYPFREYTSDDGLPQLETMRAMQDSRGYIWMNTRNGLTQFDGHSFTSFYRKDGLPSNNVSRLIEDVDGTIWAATPNGLAYFTGKTFHSYLLPDSLKIKQVGFECMTGKPGAFFLTANSKDYRKIILFDSGIYYDYSKRNPVLQRDSLVVAAFDSKDSSLYLTGPDVALCRFRKGVLSVIEKNPLTPIQVKDAILKITGRTYSSWDDLNGLYFTGNYSPGSMADMGDMLRYNPETILHELHPESNNVKWIYGGVIFYMIDRDSILWMMTDTKIFRMVSDAFIEYDEDDGLVSNPWALAADPTGGLWIGSIYGELKYFDGNRFISKDDYRGLFVNNLAFFRGSTTLSNGEVWLSTNHGVLIWDGMTFRKFKPIPEGAQVCIIYEDPIDKSVLIGTDIGLYHVRGEKTDFYPEVSPSEFGVVEGIARDNNGKYWLAGHYGIVLFDGKSFTPFRSAPAPAEMVWGIIKDYTGRIWSAGSDGILICDPDNSVFTPGLPDGMNRPANVIRDLGDHRLLVGRMLDLCIIDLDKYYSGQSDYYTILGRSRGYNGNDCQDNGIVKDANGRWWLLTSDKLIRFYPERIKKNTNPPLTHITSVEIPDATSGWVSVLDSSLFYHTGNRLSVSGLTNDIKINFTGISTRYPEDITYQYRLSELHNAWSPKTAERSVTLTDLPPGKYTFELKSYNGDGAGTPESQTLLIDVVPAFFQKLGIKIAASLMAIALIALLSLQIRRRFNRKRVAAARLQAESYKMQLSAVISQLDPHFTFNAVSSIGSLIMKGEKEKAYTYLIKLSGLLRSVLTDSSLMVKPIREEVEFVTRFLELQKLRYGNRFDYRIKVAEDVDQNMLVPKMVLQLIVENAVKHGIENKEGRGMIEVTVHNVINGTEFVVRDNGIGRKAASELTSNGAGLGIKNIISSMEMLNKGNKEKGTLTITDLYDNGKPSGTEVKGFIPTNYIFDFSMNTKQTHNKHNRI